MCFGAGLVDTGLRGMRLVGGTDFEAARQGRLLAVVDHSS
jgi:hypothetical protein